MKCSTIHSDCVVIRAFNNVDTYVCGKIAERGMKENWNLW